MKNLKFAKTLFPVLKVVFLQLCKWNLNQIKEKWTLPINERRGVEGGGIDVDKKNLNSNGEKMDKCLSNFKKS